MDDPLVDLLYLSRSSWHIQFYFNSSFELRLIIHLFIYIQKSFWFFHQRNPISRKTFIYSCHRWGINNKTIDISFFRFYSDENKIDVEEGREHVWHAFKLCRVERETFLFGACWRRLIVFNKPRNIYEAAAQKWTIATYIRLSVIQLCIDDNVVIWN